MRRKKVPRLDRRSSGGRGRGASGYALADQVYDLSRALGAVRERSIANVDALRSVAQGIPELDEAFRPLLAALEAGLAECHRADLEAIFGRPEPLRDMLESPPPPQIGHGFGRVRGGGTGAAAQRLADALSVLDRDVEAAGMLVEDGASLRTVVRWARRARKTAQSPVTVPALEGEKPSSNRTVSDDDGAANKSKSDTDNGEGLAARGARKDWTLRILREPTAGLDSDCTGDSGSGRGDEAANHAGTADGGRRDGIGAFPSRCRTKSGRNDGRRPPLVVVNALRLPLPPVPAVPAEGARVMAPIRRGLRSSSKAGSVPAIRREWRNPFSWLAGYYWRTDVEACQAPVPPLSMPPPLAPLPALPRVIVRVVYVGRAPDVARFVRAAEMPGEIRERTAAAASAVAAAAAAAAAANTGAAGCADAGASSAAGDDHESRPNEEKGSTVDGIPPWTGGTGKGNAAVVELIRSEVRVRRACFPAVAARGNPERACTNGADTEAGLASGSATQLQIVLELQTLTPVVVSRVLHTGGGVLPRPHLCLPSAASPSSPRGVSLQSALSSPGSVSDWLRPSAPAAGRGAVGDYTRPVVEGCSGRNGSDTGLGGGGGSGVGFGAGTGRRDKGIVVGAGEADSGCVGTEGAGRAAGGVDGECNQGGGSLNVGCHGQGCGNRGADEADELIPLGWVEAPVELSLPGDTAEHGPKLKVGTSHVLGMNVVLPELTSATSNPSTPQVGESLPKPPQQCTGLYEDTRAPAPRGGESLATGAADETPPKSKKRKGSFGGTGDDQQQVHADQAGRQGATRPRARKRSRRLSSANGSRTPGTGGMAGGDALDSHGCGEGQGGSSTAHNASRSSRLRGGGSGGGGDVSAGQEDTDVGTGARDMTEERKTWWGWRFPSLWGRATSGDMLLPDSNPAPRRAAQQKQQKQSTQSREASLSGISGVLGSGSTADNRADGVKYDTNNASPQESEEPIGAAGSRSVMEGRAPSSDYGVSCEIRRSPPLKRSPLVITVVLAAPPVATPA